MVLVLVVWPSRLDVFEMKLLTIAAGLISVFIIPRQDEEYRLVPDWLFRAWLANGYFVLIG